MKRILTFCFAAAALFVGCNQPEEQPVVNGDAREFSATFENEETRVYLADDYYFRWQKGDLLSVFTRDDSHRKYQTLSGDVIRTGLEYVSTTSESGNAIDAHYAIFPYAENNALAGGMLHGVIPSAQEYTADKVNLNAAVMVAKIPADEKEFSFKNSCALLKFNITKTDAFLAKLKSITVTSKSHKLAGPVTVNIDNDEFTAVIDANAAGTSNTVTLTGCEEAGILSGKPLTFFIAIPAGTYEANDLTVTFDCDVDQLDCSKTIEAVCTVGRSKYLDLNTTLGEQGGWYEEKENEVYLDDATLTNRAIMTNIPRLTINGWAGMNKVATVFDVPESGDFKITGKDLVEAGDAVDGEPPVITHVVTGNDVYIMNTFTTNQSGLAGVTPPTVTVENLTITGEYRTNSLGEYVSDAVTAPNKCSQLNFNTVFNNVNVIDSKVLPFNTLDKNVGAAVCVNGTAVLNNCVVKGTVKSEYWDKSEEYKSSRLFDMACVNNSHTTINGGEYGSIYTWEHMSLAVTNGAKVESIYYCANYAKSTSNLTIDASEVGIIDCTDFRSTIPSYGTRIYIKAGSNVGVLKMKELATSKPESYFYKIVVEEGATVGKVIINDTEMTLDEFKAAYPTYFN